MTDVDAMKISLLSAYIKPDPAKREGEC